MTLNSNIMDYASANDVKARINPGFTLSSSEAPVWLIFDANAPEAFEFVLESTANTPGLTCTIEAWNWNSNSYEVVDMAGETFNSDTQKTYTINADHIDGNGDVRTRVGWRKTGFTLLFPWTVSVDLAGWDQ